MYKPLDTRSWLATGDIIKLDLDFFKKFSRYETIIPLFEEFLKNPNYSSNLWAVLNKPCDMVHDKDGNRFLDKNLFLCPLKNFQVAFKNKEILADCAKHGTMPITPFGKTRQLYTKFTKEYLNQELPFNKDASPEEKEQRNEAYKKAKESMTGFFEKVLSDESIEYDFVIPYLKEYNEEEDKGITDSMALGKFLEYLESLPEWGRYGEELEDFKKEDSKIKLKKSKLGKISNFILNQNDSAGLFYYEPHIDLMNGDVDISYYIELDEVLTLKVKEVHQKDGSLVKALTDGKILNLDHNFSDRLLNIMGNYFSKIGTEDVKSSPILKIYETILKDDFKVEDEDKTEKDLLLEEIIKKLKKKQDNELQEILKDFSK